MSTWILCLGTFGGYGYHILYVYGKMYTPCSLIHRSYTVMSYHVLMLYRTVLCIFPHPAAHHLPLVNPQFKNRFSSIQDWSWIYTSMIHDLLDIPSCIPSTSCHLKSNITPAKDCRNLSHMYRDLYSVKGRFVCQVPNVLRTHTVRMHHNDYIHQMIQTLFLPPHRLTSELRLEQPEGTWRGATRRPDILYSMTRVAWSTRLQWYLQPDPSCLLESIAVPFFILSIAWHAFMHGGGCHLILTIFSIQMVVVYSFLLSS